MTLHSSIPSTLDEAPSRAGSSFSRPAALIGGAAALVALTAIATTLVVRPATPPSAAGAGDAGSVGATLTAPAMQADKATATPSKTTGAVHETVAAKPAPKAAAPRTANASASVCAQCGVVEAVNAVQKKGEGTGLGAVGGAVVGGLLGSAVGGGDGKKAMTVIGAVGGGVAGNEIEKRQRSTTVYQVQVRMDDGTLRTFTQANAPTVGQKVTIEGTQLKVRA